MVRPAPTRAAAREQPSVELADIFRRFGPAYRRSHTLAAVQDKAMRAIETCRTAALGGHRLECDRCGAVKIAYNSCRNRHCPKCQTLSKERWLQARRQELLDIQYFHVVFTLPHQLNSLAQGNPRVIYNLLFRAAADTLAAFAQDPEHLGGTIGVTAVLHTWGQNLSQHIHLHCIVTGGALSEDGSRWIEAKPGFLFPVRALSKVFRGKYLAALERAHQRGELKYAGSTAALADTNSFGRYLSRLRDQPWVVYCKPALAGPEQVLYYLGRYTHRVAICNHRILGFEGGNVCFLYKDYAANSRTRPMQLDATEFIRRFLLHVLPDGFCRIRHFGILANRHRKQRLAACRCLLNQPEPDPPTDETTAELMLRLTGVDITRCPVCGHRPLRTIEIFPALDRPRPTQPFDTS